MLQDERISIRVLLTKLVSKSADHILNFLVIFLFNFCGIRVLGTLQRFGSVFSVSILFCPRNKLDPRELVSKEPNATFDFLLGVSEPTKILSNKLPIFIFSKTIIPFNHLFFVYLTKLVYLSPFSFIKQCFLYFLAC